MTISVIVPCFNARPWIRATLGSVFAQTALNHAVEILVVDDGSTDGSADLVAREFPSVRLIRTRHAGPSRARNIGSRLAAGAFLQYLDADDLLSAGKLAAQVQALTESGADVAYGDWRELRRSPDGSYQPGRIVARAITGDPQIALFTDFWCPPATYLFRREIAHRVGSWNEQLPIIQDARFVLDCALHGAAFVYCPGIAAHYRVHTTASVSTHDRPSFIRDRLRNAVSVEAWWTQRGGLGPSQTQALVKVYGEVARDSFRYDEELFDAACTALERLQPGYMPAHPWHLALASRCVGYRRAEALAVHYRGAKALLRQTVRPLARVRR